MRMFFTTTVSTADAIFRDCFTDIYEFSGCEGVCFADRQLDVNDGFEGDVTLCMDAPDEVFERHEVIEDGAPPGYGRRALIPAVVLNQIGKPKVYDHYFAGCSRRDMLRVIRQKEKPSTTRTVVPEFRICGALSSSLTASDGLPH